jgi:hypothetical protein
MWLNDLANEADLRGFFCQDGAAGNEDFGGEGSADESRQSLGSSPSGDYAE